jgi:hypothetical protein
MTFRSPFTSQQGASREKYAPVVRTAARARGRDTHLSTSALFGVQIRTLFDAFSVWQVLRKNEPELSAPVVRAYCRRWCLVRRIFATIRRCPTVAPKHDFSGSTRYYKEQQGASRGNTARPFRHISLQTTNKQRILVNFSISKNSMALYNTVPQLYRYCTVQYCTTVQYSTTLISRTVLYCTVRPLESYSTVQYCTVLIVL